MNALIMKPKPISTPYFQQPAQHGLVTCCDAVEVAQLTAYPAV